MICQTCSNRLGDSHRAAIGSLTTVVALSLALDTFTYVIDWIPMLDRDQVHKVAHLARLDLTPEEEQQFTTQLGDILEYVEQLSELDTDNVQPTARAIDVSNVSRKDTLAAWEDKESILDCAPEREGEFFKVPKIMNES